MKTYNIILSNAVIENENRGCVALTVSSMILVKKVFEESGNKCVFYLTDSLKKWDGDYSYKFLSESINYKTVLLPEVSLIGFLKAIARIKRTIRFVKVLFSSDFVLDIGQGDSFADIYGEKRFRYIDRINFYSRLFHKQRLFLPQTIGPFSNDCIRDKAVNSLESSSLVMVRDRQSLDYVKQIAPSVNTKEYIDVAFSLPYSVINQDKKYVHVGLNISGLLWNGGYTRDNQFSLACDYQSTVRSIIDFFLSNPDVKLHLIPHVLSTERSLENDLEVSYELWREYNNPNLLLDSVPLGPIEIKSFISGMDFMVGARMHATIAAFSSGVPVVPMSYSRKFNGLFVDTLDYPYIVDMKSLNQEDILSMVADSFTNRDALKSLVSNRMNTIVKEKLETLTSDLKDFFGL